MGKMESRRNVCSGDSERGGPMAIKSTPKPSGGEPSVPKKVRPKKTKPETAVSNGPTAPAEAEPGSQTKTKRLPPATIRALRELQAGELTPYVDADDLFRKLGIKLGKIDTQGQTGSTIGSSGDNGCRPKSRPTG
jgi:hypothetical protein